MSKDVNLSQFDPDSITAEDVGEFDSSLEVVDGLLEVTSSKGAKRLLGQFVIPAGYYSKSGSVNEDGDLIMQMSDLTELNVGKARADRTIEMVPEGTGYFVGVDEDKLLFEEPTISYPMRFNGSSIEMNIASLKSSNYVCLLEDVPLEQNGRYFSGINKRSLNVVSSNNLNIAVDLQEHTFTLPAGRYYISGYTVMYRSGYFNCHLFDVSDDTSILEGFGGLSASQTNIATSNALFRHVLVLSEEKELYLGTTHTGNIHTNPNGTGVGPTITGTHTTNRFSQLEIWRLDDE